MLMVISPAKTLDFSGALPQTDHSWPHLIDDAASLAEQMRGHHAGSLSSLMGISDQLARRCADYFQQWRLPFTPDNARPAVFMFNGDVYRGLNAASLSAEALAFAQQRLRILSGLYGVLRPLDLIQPYRLEMGLALVNRRGKDLYAFWGARVAEALYAQMDALGSDTLVNLASAEYFRVVRNAPPKVRWVTPVFKDFKNGRYKVISFAAKRARGMMARHAIHEGLCDAEGLKRFEGGGYHYDASRSDEREWVFLREPA